MFWYDAVWSHAGANQQVCSGHECSEGHLLDCLHAKADAEQVGDDPVLGLQVHRAQTYTGGQTNEQAIVELWWRAEFRLTT